MADICICISTLLYVVAFIPKSYCFEYAYFKTEWRSLTILLCRYYSLLEEEENVVSMKYFSKCPCFLRLAIVLTFIDLCYLSFQGTTSSMLPCSCFYNLNFITLYKKKWCEEIVDHLKSPAWLLNSSCFSQNQTKTYMQLCGSPRGLSLCGYSLISISNIFVVLPRVNATYSNLKY